MPDQFSLLRDNPKSTVRNRCALLSFPLIDPIRFCAPGVQKVLKTSMGSMRNNRVRRGISANLVPLALTLILIGASNVAIATEGDSQTQLYGWGSNWNGELAQGETTDPFLTPTEIPNLPNVTAFGGGYDHNCAVSNGQLYCWGDNYYGQLGNGDSDSQSYSPMKVNGALDGVTVTDVSPGYSTTCAVAEGKAYCWGSNAFGHLGEGIAAEGSTLPVEIVGLGNVSKIAVFYYHVCAVADGSVYCWGLNDSGQIGLPISTDKTAVPNLVGGLPSGKSATDVSVGDKHSCALVDGEIYCWGMNTDGQLGNNSTTNSSTPVKVSGISNATMMDAGDYFNCVIDGGAVKCWGNNENGQIDDSGNNKLTAVPMGGALDGVTAKYISSGAGFSCAIFSDDTYCWGYNEYGQLGDGTTESTFEPPVKVQSLTGATAVEASSDWHTLARVGEVSNESDNEEESENDSALPDTGAPVALWFLGASLASIAVGAGAWRRRAQ